MITFKHLWNRILICSQYDGTTEMIIKINQWKGQIRFIENQRRRSEKEKSILFKDFFRFNGI